MALGLRGCALFWHSNTPPPLNNLYKKVCNENINYYANITFDKFDCLLSHPEGKICEPKVSTAEWLTKGLVSKLGKSGTTTSSPTLPL